MTPITFTILGEPASAKNSRRIVHLYAGGNPRVIKSEKALAYAKAVKGPAIIACIGRVMPLFPAGRLSITATLYYASERPDLDGELLCDALQGIIYTNDRQLREKHFFHRIDKLNPRAVVTVEVL